MIHAFCHQILRFGRLILIIGAIWAGSLARVDAQDSGKSVLQKAEINPDNRIASIQQHLKNNELLKALREAEQLEKRFPSNKKLQELTESLRKTTGDAITTYSPATKSPSERRRVTFKQLSGFDQTQFAILENEFKQLTTKTGSVPRAQAETLLKSLFEFQKNQSNFVRGWIMTAELALATENSGIGLSAGINLSALRADETTNPDILNLLTRLEEQGWYTPPRNSIAETTLGAGKWEVAYETRQINVKVGSSKATDSEPWLKQIQSGFNNRVEAEKWVTFNTAEDEKFVKLLGASRFKNAEIRERAINK